MPAPNPLWSGDRDPGLRDPDPDAPTQPTVTQPRPRTEAPTEPQPVVPEASTGSDRAFPPPPPPREEEPLAAEGGSRRRGPLLLAAIMGAVIAAGAFSLGALLNNDDNGRSSFSGKSSKVQKPLALSKGGAGATQAAAVYKADGESVVQVVRSGGSGTGFIVQGKGTIVTNAHVVGTATDVKVVLDDGIPPVDARVVGKDESSDLAVLAVDPAALKGRPALPLADSDDVGVGDLAIAVGYPLGLDRTVTQGIISGIGRHIQAPNGFSIDKVLQTDAPINPGNSGGPLLDARGRVIGVNSQIATAGGGSGNVGIGFSIPSNTVAKIVPALRAGQSVKHAFLGVSTSDVTGGAEIAQITPGGPAEAAGLEGPAVQCGSGGDVITKVGSMKITNSDDVATAIENKSPGDTVTVKVRRDGASKSVQVTLGARPTNTSGSTSCGGGGSQSSPTPIP